MAELLAPAGNIESLDAAIGEGADAVYLGLKSFNARLRTSNFAWNQFEAAVQSIHRQKKKIFVTVNTVIEEKETERMYRFLAYLDKIGPDGIIVQDFGVVRLVQEFFPNLRLHASTQMNIASSRAANLMGKQGLSRIVLARELGLEEIKQIKERSNVELEVFVHGALCVSESGLCLFSSFLGGKSANRGMCTQACRRYYTAQTGGSNEQGYYFSPLDLQLIEKIPDLITAGVDSFKIEGRMKSAEYVGSVVSAYRYLIDHWQEDKEGALATAKRLLSSDFARAKTMYRFESNSAEQVLNPNQAGGTGIYLGKIERVTSEKNDEAENGVQWYAFLRGGNYDPEIGDSIRLHKKDDTGRLSHKVRAIKQKDSHIWIDIPAGFSAGDSVYLLQTKAMSKRYSHVLPKDLSKFRSQPDGRELPILDLTPIGKKTLDFFPEGLYVHVSTVKDMYVVLQEHPVRVILELNSESKKSLLETKETLPFSRKQVIIWLEPFCPQEMEDTLAENVHQLVEMGFHTWVVNNPAHISMLKAEKANLIAGPYLYTFNRWAVSWLDNQNITALIPPLENSQKNIEATFAPNQRSRVLITLFAYPALFRMRFKLPESYDFLYFTDKENIAFKAFSSPDGSFVLPEIPFSVVDKAKKLRSLGFTRVLIDLSKTVVTKADFKQILSALYTGKTLSGTNRFNFKNGFYDPDKVGSDFNASSKN